MSFILATPSPEWPRLFMALRDELQAAFASTPVVIEHIGSTSVPGLAAKPVIDILVGTTTLADIESRIPALVAAGFAYRPEHEAARPMRRYFTKTPTGSLRAHVHAVERDGKLWRDHLAFRDALRSDAHLRDRYQALKRQLAQRFAHDKSAYTEAKAPFIRDTIATLRRSEPPPAT